MTQETEKIKRKEKIPKYLTLAIAEALLTVVLAYLTFLTVKNMDVTKSRTDSTPAFFILLITSTLLSAYLSCYHGLVHNGEKMLRRKNAENSREMDHRIGRLEDPSLADDFNQNIQKVESRYVSRN